MKTSFKVTKMPIIYASITEQNVPTNRVIKVDNIDIILIELPLESIQQSTSYFFK